MPRWPAAAMDVRETEHETEEFQDAPTLDRPLQTWPTSSATGDSALVMQFSERLTVAYEQNAMV